MLVLHYKFLHIDGWLKTKTQDMFSQIYSTTEH